MKCARIAVVLIALIVLVVAAGCGHKTLEKNYGYSYGEVNTGSGGAEDFDASTVVPSKSVLTDNLEKAGFIVSESDNALSFAYDAECIHAEKDGHFIDICYNLTLEYAPEAFASYEEVFEDYYVLAQNGPYVYVVSDAETYQMAGFESLETDGILFIWK